MFDCVANILHWHVSFAQVALFQFDHTCVCVLECVCFVGELHLKYESNRALLCLFVKDGISTLVGACRPNLMYALSSIDIRKCSNEHQSLSAYDANVKIATIQSLLNHVNGTETTESAAKSDELQQRESFPAKRVNS